MTAEGYMDYAPFASSRFDPTAYANAILAGERYDPEEALIDEPESSTNPKKAGGGSVNGMEGAGARNASNGTASLTVKGDVSVALANLNYGIEDVDRQMKQEIETHHPLLLTHLASSSTLSSNVTTIQSTLSTLSTSLSRLHNKIHLPHSDLKAQVDRLEKTRTANEVLRRVSRFLVLARRLESQMKAVQGGDGGGDGAGKGGGEEGEREREMAKAALTIAELDILLQEPEPTDPDEQTPTSDEHADAASLRDPEQIPLTSLDIVKNHVPGVKRFRDIVIEEMEGMVINGLANLNQALLSTSLQTAHNLRLLPQLVSNLLADLNDAVETRIGKAFDLDSIGQEVAQKEQPSAASAATSLLYRTARLKPSSTPTNQNLGLFHDVLWRRLDILLEDIAQCCIKVYTLEKVLKMKKVANPNAGVGGGGLGNPAGEMSVLEDIKEGSFLDECLETMEEKPTFTFWTTLATSLDTQTRAICEASNFVQQTLSASYPRLLRLFHGFFAKIGVHTETIYSQEHQSPETVLCLRAISKFETLYLSRASTRMTDSINSAFGGGYKQPPSSREGDSVARVMLNEMDAARFDPLLGRSMARLLGKAIDAITGKVDGLLVKDFSATSLVGPLASSAQVNNSALVSFMYHIAYNIRNPFTEFPSKVTALLQAPLQAAERCYETVTSSLDTAIKRELSTIFARVHRVDFAKSVDPMNSMGMGGGSGGSPYIKDLADRLNFLRVEILGRFDTGPMRDAWLIALTRHAIHAFLLNASIARPLGESGKLKLTGDMTELEFALNTFLATGNTTRKNLTRLDATGREYKSLRAFRTCLFLDHTSLGHPSETRGIAPLVLLHHIVVLSPLQLPHQIHEWSEQEYILWIGKHSDEEGWRLLEKAVDGQREGQGAEEWRTLIRDVLKDAREGKMQVD